MSFVNRYWVAGLVLLLVMIHAMIIGYVRSEATKLKSVSSSEIPLGLYYVQSHDRQWLTQLRVLLSVPLERRLAAKATIEHNRWLVHEAIEEALRQIDHALLADASLLKIKETIKHVIDETLHEKIVERVVICDRFDLPVDHFRMRVPNDVTAPSESLEPIGAVTKLTHARGNRPTASEQSSDAKEHGGGHGDSHGEHGESDGHGGEKAHGGEHGDGHGEAHGDSGGGHADDSGEHEEDHGSEEHAEESSHGGGHGGGHAKGH